MRNKPNLCVFWAVSGDCEEKQSQTNPIYRGEAPGEAGSNLSRPNFWRSWIELFMFGVVSLILTFAAGCQSNVVGVESPNEQVRAKIFVNNSGRLSYNLRRGQTTILEDSPMSLTVDGVDICDGVVIAEPRYHTVNQSYPWRGVKSEAVDHYTGMRLPVTHKTSGLTWKLESHTYDDGFAWRYTVPGKGTRTVSDEKTAWLLPADAQIWYHTNTEHYEGVHQKQSPQAINQQKPVALPVTVELSDGSFAAITEAMLINYSGITLQPTGTSKLVANFTDNPDGFEVEGNILSPWRVTMTGPDLNTLVNCDIVHNLCRKPDKKLFPQGIRTEWIRPGRSLWHWWSSQRSKKFKNGWSFPDFAEHKGWIDAAGQLGFEYYLVDDSWEEDWNKPQKDQWAHLKELADYARARNVRINVWRDWKEIRTPEHRLDFFKRCREAGAAGVKIDYMNSESAERIKFYTDTLRDAAKYQLMVNFHGANKPTGLSRTWPNEMTREGVRGLEYNKWSQLEPAHYATIPFTRYLAGHGDFTPCTFNPAMLKGTTPTLQLATAIVYTSPLLHWADEPKYYLQSPAVEIIKQIPSVWDETRVLEGSKIGELAAFARRNSNNWFVGIINGSNRRHYELDLSFLGEGSYNAILVRDNVEKAAKMIVERTTIDGGQKLKIQMRQGGGFVAYFYK